MWIKDLIRKELGLGLGKKTKYEKSKYEGEIIFTTSLTVRNAFYITYND